MVRAKLAAKARKRLLEVRRCLLHHATPACMLAAAAAAAAAAACLPPLACAWHWQPSRSILCCRAAASPTSNRPTESLRLAAPALQGDKQAAAEAAAAADEERDGPAPPKHVQRKLTRKVKFLERVAATGLSTSKGGVAKVRAGAGWWVAGAVGGLDRVQK